MKNIALLFLLFISSLNFAKAQTDYCKEIVKTRHAEKQYSSYDTPGLEHIYLNNTISDGDTTGLVTVLFLATKKTADYNAGGLYVTFADGTVWKDEGAHLNCSYINSDYGYRYGGASVLDDKDALLPFKTKKIVKILMGDIEIPISDEYATKFKAWANCIEHINQIK